MFKNAIVRKPSMSVIDGISSGEFGKPDFKLAKKQHTEYINALEFCGLNIHIINENEEFPDSVFVEDTAVIAGEIAIITNPGALSRRRETDEIEIALKKFFKKTEKIRDPGTVDGGDVMLIENIFYIGLSGRTNRSGIDQFKKIVEKRDFVCKTVPLSNFLHLKTGVSYLGKNTILTAGELINSPLFTGFNRIEISDDDSYSANSIRVNEYIIIPADFKNTRKKIENRGFKTVEVDVSEFRKIDGGLSCLSIRF